MFPKFKKVVVKSDLNLTIKPKEKVIPVVVNPIQSNIEEEIEIVFNKDTKLKGMEVFYTFSEVVYSVVTKEIVKFKNKIKNSGINDKFLTVLEYIKKVGLVKGMTLFNINIDYKECKVKGESSFIIKANVELNSKSVNYVIMGDNKVFIGYYNKGVLETSTKVDSTIIDIPNPTYLIEEDKGKL